ncbi:DUF1573 domain-containing protein [Bacteroidia bacterium]|nr:DUF1573 domain-containing protein [Bacteroidia bacterium]MDB9882097.1 DUF1573 domain-containing protein [Bacteroidia bacterium]MDC1395331.1 DUF1573 domain-containing protein [Bacteroidia bacterium]
MKNILLAILSLVSFNAFAQLGPQITFEQRGLKLDSVVSGTVVNVTYYFKNTGDSPVKLTKVKATCGCTIPSYPKYEILPGTRDSITAVFDTKGRKGYQAKGINIESTAGSKSLVFEILVTEPDTPIEEVDAIEVEDHSGHNH